MQENDVVRSLAALAQAVRAPIAGTVLAIEVDEGEFVSPGSISEFVALGDVGALHVRVQIDELDAWRFTPDCKAVAAPRGGSPARYPLTYLRTVPYVVPKKSLTGESAERIDVRIEPGVDTPMVVRAGGECLPCAPIPAFLMDMVQAGGLLPLLKQQHRRAAHGG